MDLQEAFDAGFESVKDYIDNALAAFETRLHLIEARPLAKDGAGIAGFVKNESGILVLTLTDGRVVDTGIRDGKDGRDGVDGQNGSNGKDGANGLDGKDGAPGMDGKNGDPGKDGTDAIPLTAEDVRPIIVSEVAKAVTEIEAVASDLVGKAVAAVAEKVVLPVLPDIPALVADAVKALPAPAAGKDADMVEAARIIKDEVAKAVGALPRPKDGIGLAGGIITREGTLTLTLTDGTTRDLGRVEGRDADMAALRSEIKTLIDALPKPKDGIDGIGFDNLDFEIGEDGAFLTFLRGDQRKTFRLPIVIDRGVWREKGAYHAGDGVTWAGSYWIAQRETTKAKPDAGNGDWRLAVKRGADGKDAKAA